MDIFVMPNRFLLIAVCTLSDRKQNLTRHSWWMLASPGTRWFIFPFCKERCSFRLIDFVLPTYKNGVVLVPILSMIAPSADSFSSYVLYGFCSHFTVYDLSRYKECWMLLYTLLFPSMLVGWVGFCTQFHFYIRPFTLSSLSLQDPGRHSNPNTCIFRTLV